MKVLLLHFVRYIHGYMKWCAVGILKHVVVECMVPESESYR